MLKKNFLIFSLSFTTLIIQSEMINEIVVTGDWRESKLSDVGASLALITDEQIERKQLKHFEDVTYLVPNLNFAASDSRPRYFQIRGIGERSGYEGTPNSSVGFLIDDIDFSGQGGIASTFDIEQIEIYRGPQGSRMGANALAGMVYIQTKDPEDLFQLKGGLTYGDFGRKDIKALINIPFSESIQSRLIINKEDFDGFRKNLFFNSKDTSRKDERSLRFKTKWQVSQNSFLNLVYFSNDFDDPSDIWTIDGSLNTLSDRPGMDSQDSDALGLKYRLENSLTQFQILFSETDTDVIFSYDADWGNPQSHYPIVYDYFSETIRNRETSSLEFRFLSKPQKTKAGNVDWVFGYSLFEIDESNTKNDDGAYGDPSDGFGIFRSESIFMSDYSSESKSLFGNLDYLFTENIKFSIGVRWEDWKADYLDSKQEDFNPSDDMNGGKISLTNKMSDDLTVYFSAARGYKQGGFNLGTGLNNSNFSSSIIYAPEYLTNYELGLNRYFAPSNTYIDFVFFYSDRQDQQVFSSTQVDPQDPNTFLYLTQNAAEGVNYGAEFSLNSQLSDSLGLFLNIGFLETKIQNYASRPDLEGREQAHAPSNSFSAGVNWELNKDIELLVDITGKSDFYYSDSHDNQSDGYVLTNLNLIYKKDNLNFNLWLRNVFDEYYSLRGFYFGNEPPNFEDTLYERHGDPRHYGFSISYDF